VKGAFLTVLIQCTGVWFAGSKYGLSWKAIQIRADKVPESIRGFAFLDDGEEATEAPAPVKARAAVPAPPPAPVKPANQFANLADEEDDDQVDDEEALAPAPVKPVVAPLPSVAEEEDDGEDIPPVPVPAKKTLTKPKKLVVSSKK
jgi:hypothetical protein